MPDPASPPPPGRIRGAGGPFILLLMAGIVIGFLLGQATVGFLVGLVAAIAVAVWLWMRDHAA